MDNLGNRFHVNFLGYSYWFMSILISQMKYHYIYVYQARYASSIVAKYLDTATVNTSTNVYKTTLTSGVIFTKADTSTSNNHIERFTRDIKIPSKPLIRMQ